MIPWNDTIERYLSCILMQRTDSNLLTLIDELCKKVGYKKVTKLIAGNLYHNEKSKKAGMLLKVADKL